MKIFIDSANLLEIEEALERGFPSGITTNPSILAKEEKADFRDHINKIIELVQRYGYDIPLSVEVFSTRPDEMITQAEDFVRHFGHYPKLNVKVPVGWDELAVIPPVAGGAPGPEDRMRSRLIELTTDPIDGSRVAALLDSVPTDADGAVATFVGRTRETPGTPAPGQEAEAARFAGQRVDGLEY